MLSFCISFCLFNRFTKASDHRGDCVWDQLDLFEWLEASCEASRDWASWCWRFDVPLSLRYPTRSLYSVAVQMRVAAEHAARQPNSEEARNELRGHAEVEKSESALDKFKADPIPTEYSVPSRTCCAGVVADRPLSSGSVLNEDLGLAVELVDAPSLIHSGIPLACVAPGVSIITSRICTMAHLIVQEARFRMKPEIGAQLEKGVTRLLQTHPLPVRYHSKWMNRGRYVIAYAISKSFDSCQNEPSNTVHSPLCHQALETISSSTCTNTSKAWGPM